MYVCSVVIELCGRSVPQISSMRVGTGTTRPGYRASSARICRGLPALGTTEIPSNSAFNAPRTFISIIPSAMFRGDWF